MAQKKYPNRKPRCTEQQKAQRRLHVADLLCNGLDLHHICQDAVVKAWDLDRKTIHRDYVLPAWAELAQYLKEEELPVKRAKAIAERDRLKLRCIVRKDFATALRAMDSRDKIEGVLVDREPVAFMFNTGSIPPEMKKRLDKELSGLFRKS